MQTEKLKASPNTVGAYYAKTHFSELLDRVEKGERITITRHGEEVATLGAPPKRDVEKIRQTIRDMQELQKKHTLGGITIKELIEEGRRF